MKKIFFALIALCAFVVILPSCGEPNNPDVPDTPENPNVPNDSTETPGDSIESVIAFEVKGVSFNMVRVEGGTFMMGALTGDEDAYDDEKPRHKVTLSDFAIGETEVTPALWNAVMGNNPSYFGGDNKPVESVSWDDCQEFVRILNSLTGKNFRLPTEAEWEFAARGGRKSEGYLYSGGNTLSLVGWYGDNSGGQIHPVASLSPNELGLYDMSGNVWEWCQDWYDCDYYGYSPVDNPQGPESGLHRVCRGGYWQVGARFCRSSCRYHDNPGGRVNYLGLRLALSE